MTEVLTIQSLLYQQFVYICDSKILHRLVLESSHACAKRAARDRSAAHNLLVSRALYSCPSPVRPCLALEALLLTFPRTLCDLRDVQAPRPCSTLRLTQSLDFEASLTAIPLTANENVRRDSEPFLLSDRCSYQSFRN